jgi:hypothetical protein
MMPSFLPKSLLKIEDGGYLGMKKKKKKKLRLKMEGYLGMKKKMKKKRLALRWAEGREEKLLGHRNDVCMAGLCYVSLSIYLSIYLYLTSIFVHMHKMMYVCCRKSNKANMN